MLNELLWLIIHSSRLRDRLPQRVLGGEDVLKERPSPGGWLERGLPRLAGSVGSEEERVSQHCGEPAGVPGAAVCLLPHQDFETAHSIVGERDCRRTWLLGR